MPTLAAKIGFQELLGIHGAIVGSLTPAEVAQSGALMLPAMNVEDRVELLGGMQAGAPPEVFAGMMRLAQSVISPPTTPRWRPDSASPEFTQP
jgi:hypothetical protein